MPLVQTIEVPPGDPAPVLAEPIIKMIVLGNRPALAQLADDLTTNPPIVVRKVIWFKHGLPENYQAIFQVQDLLHVQAFSLSIGNVVADRIMIDEVADYVRVDQCYTSAAAL